MTTLDPDTGDTFTYLPVSGEGDTDNESFQIVGNQLRSAAGFDFETKQTYTVRVRSTDARGLYYEKSFTISVTDVAEALAPELHPTNVSAYFLSYHTWYNSEIGREQTDTLIRVSWEASLTGLTHYDVQYGSTENGPWTDCPVIATDGSYSDNHYLHRVNDATWAAGSHYYRVRGSIDGPLEVNSGWSEPVELEPYAGPTGLSVKPDGQLNAVVSWDASPAAISYYYYLTWSTGATGRVQVSGPGCSSQITFPVVGSTYTVTVVSETIDAEWGGTNRESVNNQSVSFFVPALVSTEDDDGDDLNNGLEWTHRTDPLKADSDGDLLPDGWEHGYGMDPTNVDADANGISDAGEDPDGDGLSNLREFQNGSDPASKDTDGDGISDAVEVTQGTDPTNDGEFRQELPYDMVATIGMLVTGGPNIPGFSDVWSLNVGDKTCTMPDSNTDGYVQHQFPRGDTYDVTVEHVGAIGPNYGWGADIHLSHVAQGIVDNEGGPLGPHATIEPASSDPTGMLAKLHLFQLDADIDSNNDSGFTEPSNNVAEDWTELDSTTGKIVWADTGDVDGDGTVDTNDHCIPGGHFVPMVIRLSDSVTEAQLSDIVTTIEYDDSVLHVWKQDASTLRSVDLSPDGTNHDDLVLPGEIVSVAPGESGKAVLWVEAVQDALAPLAINFTTTVDGVLWDGTLTDTVHVLATSVDLDVDSDNNGYINTEANAERMKAEDALEEQTAKPITFFGEDSPEPESARYLPLRLTLPKSATDQTFSFHYTANIAVYEKIDDEYVQIPSNSKYPVAEALAEYWVQAIGVGPTGFESGFDKVHVVVWDSQNRELARDTVCFKVQDNVDHLTDWVVPNGWTIDGDSLKTPMRVTGALGPQTPGSYGTASDHEAGNTPGDYNEGNAYTRNSVGSSFTLNFDVTLGSQYVQGDYRDPREQVDDATDVPKLSFVANSGVKIGPLDGTKTEIAILDVVAWVDRVGGLIALNKADVWNDDKVTITSAGVKYVEEPLNRLMSGVIYGGSYDKMADAAGVTGNGWEYYYQVLANNYNRFKALGSSCRMRTRYADGVLIVEVASSGSTTYAEVYRDTYSLPADSRLSLQTHWGSGVTFSSITIL